MTTTSAALGAFNRKVSQRLKLLLSAGVIAFASLATTAAPARAQTSDELLRFLLGAAAVAVVVRSFDSSASSSTRRAQLPRGTLPVACKETVRLNRRQVDLYHAGCLGWYGISRLPQRCETRIRTDRGRRSYYLAQCLHESGWRPDYASAPSRPRHDPVPPRARDRRDCPPGWQGQPRRHNYRHCERGRWSHR